MRRLFGAMIGLLSPQREPREATTRSAVARADRRSRVGDGTGHTDECSRESLCLPLWLLRYSAVAVRAALLCSAARGSASSALPPLGSRGQRRMGNARTKQRTTGRTRRQTSRRAQR